MWRWGVVAVLVVVSLLVSSDTAHVAPARADDSDERAIEVAAERTGISRSRLRIAQATEARFPTIGLAARAYKVEDAQTGRLEGVLLDKGGKVLDARAVEQAEAQARLQKYGRL